VPSNSCSSIAGWVTSERWTSGYGGLIQPPLFNVGVCKVINVNPLMEKTVEKGVVC